MHERTDFSRHPDPQPKGQAARVHRERSWRRPTRTLRSSSWTMPRPTARSACSTAAPTRACTTCATATTAARAMPATSARSAHGSTLAFQDSDDLWHPDKLQKQYDLLTATGADLCYCGMNRVAASGSSFYYPVHAPHPRPRAGGLPGRKPRQHADHAHAPHRVGDCALR